MKNKLVQIAYTIPLKNIKKEVRKIIEDVDLGQHIKNSFSKILFDLHEYNINLKSTQSAISNIEEVRELLKKMDIRLNDCSNILNGYLKEEKENEQQQ